MKPSPRPNLLRCLLFTLLLISTLEARVIVLPFQAVSPDKMDRLWLGRAISFYLTLGLESSAIETVPDHRMHSLLIANNINFPYHLSKASGIKLSMLAGADTLIWGEILLPERADSGEAQVRGYIIDLKQPSQKYLPLIKFNITDLFTFQREMLGLIMQYFRKAGPQAPAPGVDLYAYETFIKGLLLTDQKQRIDLLESIYQSNRHSDLLNLELAKAWLAAGNPEKSGNYFKALTGNGFLKADRLFLNALLELDRGNIEAAHARFTDLLAENRYESEACNNLGVIRFQDNDLDAALAYFSRSLSRRRDPEVFGNYIQALISAGKTDQSRAAINTALGSFPDDDHLLRLFSFFLARDANRDRLVPVFRRFIPEMETPAQMIPETAMRFKNPFDFQIFENQSYRTDMEKALELHRRGMRIEAIKMSEQLLETNPFIPRIYRMLQEIYREQKNRKMAESYSLSAAYLENQLQL